MRQRILWLINSGVALLTAVLLFTHFAQPPQVQSLPGAGTGTIRPATALAFLTYPGEGKEVNASLNSTAVTIAAYPVDQNQQLNTTSP
jgi:hypothetical protein